MGEYIKIGIYDVYIKYIFVIDFQLVVCDNCYTRRLGVVSFLSKSNFQSIF